MFPSPFASFLGFKKKSIIVTAWDFNTVDPSGTGYILVFGGVSLLSSPFLSPTYSLPFVLFHVDALLYVIELSPCLSFFWFFRVILVRIFGASHICSQISTPPSPLFLQ